MLAATKATLPGARVVVCFDDQPYSSTDALPKWGCTSAANGTAVVKIGWTRQSTDTNAADADQVRGTGEVGRPSVVLPLIAGSTT